MSMMNRGTVDILINQDKVYRGGDVVEGRIFCTFYGVAYTREISIRLERQEVTHWREDSKILWCGEDKSVLESKVLSAGIYVGGRNDFPFSFQLPQELAGTFSFRNGGVNYFLRVEVLTEYFYCHAEKEITVESRIDFNRHPNKTLMQKPHIATVEKEFFSLFCLTEGNIIMDVSLPKTGFVPDEAAHVSVTVYNTSRRNISSLEVYLIQNITLKATSPFRQSIDAIYSLINTKQEGVKSGDHKHYNFALKIPRTAIIPDFSQCKLFSKSCVIEVVAVLPKSRNVKIKIPVVLGHVPLRSEEKFGSNFVPQHRQGYLYPTSSDSSGPSSRNLSVCQPFATSAPSSDICRNAANGAHGRLQTSAFRLVEPQTYSSYIPVSIPLVPVPSLASYPNGTPSKWNFDQSDVLQFAPSAPAELYPSGDSSQTTQPSNGNSRSRWDIVSKAVPTVATNHRLPYSSDIALYSDGSILSLFSLFLSISLQHEWLMTDCILR